MRLQSGRRSRWASGPAALLLLLSCLGWVAGTAAAEADDVKPSLAGIVFNQGALNKGVIEIVTATLGSPKVFDFNKSDKVDITDALLYVLMANGTYTLVAQGKADSQVAPNATTLTLMSFSTTASIAISEEPFASNAALVGQKTFFQLFYTFKQTADGPGGGDQQPPAAQQACSPFFTFIPAGQLPPGPMSLESPACPEGPPQNLSAPNFSSGAGGGPGGGTGTSLPTASPSPTNVGGTGLGDGSMQPGGAPAAAQVANNGLSTGAKVGIAVGVALGALVVVAGLVWCLWLRRSRRRRPSHHGMGMVGSSDASDHHHHHHPGAAFPNGGGGYGHTAAHKEATVAGIAETTPDSPYSDGGARSADAASYLNGGAAAAAGGALANGAAAHQQPHHSPYAPYSDHATAAAAAGGPQMVQHSPSVAHSSPRGLPAVVAGGGVGASSSSAAAAGSGYQTDEGENASGRPDTPPAISERYRHLVEEGMTEDELRRLEDEERQLDAAIERAGASGRR